MSGRALVLSAWRLNAGASLSREKELSKHQGQLAFLARNLGFWKLNLGKFC